ncbi:hypothetical protein FCL40_12205 [Ferrimonas sediminicola]|uniref:Uncharacterized protein n=1 Tax=Ferrimonas sediminicola TaxID=2569538 RepID=A0A4U1BD32_9GAMM|nr:hypothetical protein [Ferrimonas sediminicola]TKB48466.1 hypothetical protein FCL40_12205 [Ferrimonas sediminicola]
MLRSFLIILLFYPFILLADSLPRLLGEDQFGQPCAVDRATSLLLLSHDKASAHLAMEAISRLWPRGDAPLQLVVDTREVPSWVMSWFMLPKLRRHNTPLCLDDQGRMTQALAPGDGEVLLIELRRLVVERRRQFRDGETLGRALERLSSR